MGSSPNEHGILTPIGGGDPIPLRKMELIIGRRPGCDVRLDFENVSGKHATLQLINGFWHVRDLGSTNGTTVNGTKASGASAVKPDDEIGFAGHLFTIDYTPSGPDAVLAQRMLAEEDDEGPKKKSLLELAGFNTDGDRPRRAERSQPAPAPRERPSIDEAEFDDAVPEEFSIRSTMPGSKAPADDEFFQFFEDDDRDKR